MKSIAKIICCVVTLSWLSGATAEGVVIHENANSVTLESTQTSAVPAPQEASAPVYDKVDRARAEQRLESNALRAKKRTEQAKKEAASRAAKAPPANPARNNQGTGK
ncbi:hypothetical protein [Candidatus Ferrigenium straubiae]|jgi:hypothetical protein|uniref:hypothetical protein n=1 Tax=Candidatus Ferrigenium straubiae TaxID=2919506 RepID=UPI003F4AE673